MNNIINTKCKYCTIPDVPIVIKKINDSWIPFEADQKTRHIHKHEKESEK